MLVALTVRKLKPGTYEQFRKAWEPDPEDWSEPWERAYHVRNLNDENEVISFGLFDGTPDDYRAMAREREETRVDRMSAFVDQVLVDGVYEVIDEVSPRGGAS